MSDMPERDLELACARELGERLGQPFETLAEKAARLEAEQGPQPQSDPGDGAWHTVWLESNWEWVTSRMTTPQREHAADAVARYSRYLAYRDGDPNRGEPEGLRWWRET